MLLERFIDAGIIDNGFVSLKQTVRKLEPVAWIYTDGDPFKRPKAAVFALPDGELAHVPSSDDSGLAFNQARYLNIKDLDPPFKAILAMDTKAKGVNIMQPLSLVHNKLGETLDPQLSDWLRKAAGYLPTSEGESRPSPR